MRVPTKHANTLKMPSKQTPRAPSKYGAGTSKSAARNPETLFGYQNKEENCKNTLEEEKIDVLRQHLEGSSGTLQTRWGYPWTGERSGDKLMSSQ